MVHRILALGFLGVGSGFLACQEPTQVLVEITTDIAQENMPIVQVEVVENDGTMIEDFPIDRQSSAAPPWSFGIVRENNDTAGIRIQAFGRNGSATVTTATRTVSQFRAGESFQVSLFLAQNCIDLGCGPNESCGPCGCHPQDRDPPSHATCMPPMPEWYPMRAKPPRMAA